MSGRPGTVLFDTDVLIWVLRGSDSAARLIDRTEERLISSVSQIELLQGARDRKEVKAVKSFLGDRGFTVVPLTENIGHRATIYVEEYGLGGGLRLADALIAATAVERDVPLCTGDKRHYRQIKDLDLSPFAP